MDFGEGFTMGVAKMFANGSWHWSIPPYLTLMYGVGYYLLQIPIIHIFGFSLTDGRMVSLIATIVTLAFVYLMAYHFTKNKKLSLIACLLPLVDPVIRAWSLQARVDMLALMFAVIGMYLVIKYQNTKWVFLSIIPFFIGFHVKYTMVALPVTCLYLLFTQFKKGLLYSIIVGGLIGGSIIIGDAITNGMFIKELLTYNQTSPFMWANKGIITSNFNLTIYPLIGTMILSLFYAMYNRKNILSWWLVASLVWDTFSLIRNGSYINYYVEAIIVVSICAVLAIPQLELAFAKVDNRKNIILIWFMLLMVGWQIFVSCFMPFEMPNKEYTLAMNQSKEIISDTSKPIITENAGLVLNAGKQLEIEPFVFNNLYYLGLWDDSTLINQIDNGQFDYVVVHLSLTFPPLINPPTHFTLGIDSAITSNYTIIYEDENYQWYQTIIYESNVKIIKDGGNRCELLGITPAR